MSRTAILLSLLGGLALGCGVERFELLPTSASTTREVAVGDEPSPGEPGPAAPDVVAGPSATPGLAEQLPEAPVLEVTEPPVLEPPVLEPRGPGCQKIDFLFVIDNSSSMRDERENLARSFPGFIQVLQQVLEARDFHIMVVDTGGSREDEDEPSLNPAACAEVQGAGKRASSAGDDCGIAGGGAFMADGQPDLEQTFACVAQVGTDGSIIEEPMDAVLAATGAALNAPGRCNAGFLRDDAVLVVTLITDEEDSSSSGDPEDWRRALLAVKGENPDALVLLGLVGDNNVEGGLLGGRCSALDADGSPRLQSLITGLDGVLGSVCAPDYAPFFQTAVGTIDGACSAFIPSSP